LCAGTPVEFIIVARNDLNENRTSGRDNFKVKIKKEIPKPENYDKEQAEASGEAIPWKRKFTEDDCDIVDNQDGSYKV
jgi:hypothetical protein